MKKFTVAAIAASLLAVPAVAQAGTMSAKKRAQLEADVRAGKEVQKSLEERNRHLDRAVRAAEGIDKTIGYATGRTGTRGAYELGKKIGKAGYDSYKKRKQK